MRDRSTSRFGRTHLAPRALAGFTLIELMVAMVLGLIVVGGVISVFIANQRTYRTNQALGDVQDGSRTAFEMMARDIRGAGLTGCTNNGRLANVIKNPSTYWWANWNNSLIGYGGSQTDAAVAVGTGEKDRVAGTDSLMLMGAESSGFSVKLNTEPAGTFTLNESTTDLAQGDVIIVCDPDHAALVQIDSLAAGTITHDKDTGTPGNCTKDLSFPSTCAGSSSYLFVTNSQLSRLNAVDWYIGINPALGRSLYRVSLVNNDGVPTATRQEMVRDVTDMTLGYHQSPGASFVDATLVTNWALVDAIRVTLSVESVDKKSGTDAKAISRSFTATTSVRNRVI